VAGPVRAQVVEIVAPPAPARRCLAARSLPDLPHAHRVHRREHEHLLVVEERRPDLDEKPERERGRGAEPRPPAPPARGGPDLPPDEALRPGGDPRHVRESSRRPEPPPVLEPDGPEPVIQGALRSPAGEPSGSPRQW